MKMSFYKYSQKSVHGERFTSTDVKIDKLANNNVNKTT